MRLAYFKETLLLFFAGRLRKWAWSVEAWAIRGLQQSPGESVAGADVIGESSASESGPDSSPPADWARRRTTGPPPHWVELVRQKAPELLSPNQHDIFPAQASEDLSNEGYVEVDEDLETDNLPPVRRKTIVQELQSEPPPKNRTRGTLARGKPSVRPSRLPFRFLRAASTSAKPPAHGRDQGVEHSSIPQSVEPSRQDQWTEPPLVALPEQRPISSEKKQQNSAPKNARPAGLAKPEPRRALTIDRSTRHISTRTSPGQPQRDADLQGTLRNKGPAPDLIKTTRRVGSQAGRPADRPLDSSLKDFSSRTDSAARAIPSEGLRTPAVSAADTSSSSDVFQEMREEPRSSESVISVASRRLRVQERVTRQTSSPGDALLMRDELASEFRLVSPARSTRSVLQSREFSQPRLQTSAVNVPALMDEETMNEAASVASAAPGIGENPWPDLPTAPVLEITDEVAARERQMERLQRLEREQRGTLWNA